MAVTAHTMEQIGWQPQKCHFLPVPFKCTTLKGNELSFVMSYLKKWMWQVDNLCCSLSCLQCCDFCLILKWGECVWLSGYYIFFRNSKKKSHIFLISIKTPTSPSDAKKTWIVTKNSTVCKCWQILVPLEWKVVSVHWKTFKIKNTIIKHTLQI